MKVLIACETSGVSRRAFQALGHDVMSCDLLPADDGETERHYIGDVRDILYDGWDLMIAHPSCTYLCNSGVCHLYKDVNRWPLMYEAAEFFKLLFDAPIDKICIENPIPHKYAVQAIGRKYDCITQPYLHGHMERKATCLWLKNLPKLVPTNNVKDEMLLLPKKDQQRMHYMSPGKDRWKARSKTYEGIGMALAQQYGGSINGSM